MRRKLSLRKRTVKFFILAAVLVALIFALCACGGNLLTEEQLDEMGYNIIVKYDFNGGLNSDSLGQVIIRVRAGSKIPEPGGSGASFGAPSKAKCSIRGFYTGTETADGINYSNNKWDFSKDTVTENITLYALWWDNFTVNVHCDDGEADRVVEYPISRNTETGESDLVYAQYFSATSLGMSNRTIVGYYADAACSEDKELEFPCHLDFVDEEGGRVIDIYVKSIVGNWTVIGNADALKKGFANNANVYLKKDIDMAGESVNFPSEGYVGLFNGNGKKISNFTVVKTVANGIKGTCNLGLFDSVGIGAEIKDVTFENVSVNVTLSANSSVTAYNIGLFAGKIDSGATVRNVVISGALTYNKNNSTADIEAKEFGGLISSTATVENCVYDNVTIQETIEGK